MPGIWTDSQEAGWKAVAAKVHETPGAVLCMQLWHMGRVTHSTFGNGQVVVCASLSLALTHYPLQPWAPSAVAAVEKARTPFGALPCEVMARACEGCRRAALTRPPNTRCRTR